MHTDCFFESWCVYKHSLSSCWQWPMALKHSEGNYCSVCPQLIFRHYYRYQLLGSLSDPMTIVHLFVFRYHLIGVYFTGWLMSQAWQSCRNDDNMIMKVISSKRRKKSSSLPELREGFIPPNNSFPVSTISLFGRSVRLWISWVMVSVCI